MKGTNSLGRATAGGAALLAAATLASFDVDAFADNGHRVVGLIAEHHLHRARALGEVRRILRPGETLSDAAIWPDEIKDPAFEDAETPAFRLEHPAHDVYHYANLPLQSTRYAPDVPGARPMDILQTMRECLRVLRGQSGVFTPREALRLFAHLVGDVHQPLHVGSAYVASEGPLTFVTPSAAQGWRPALGGNALVYGPEDRFNLHSYWDAHAVNLAMRRDGPEAYAAQLVRRVPPAAEWQGRGDVEGWPEAWVNEALPLARAAHDGLRLLAYVGADSSGRTPHRWRIEQPPDYDDRARTIVPTQLAKAGFRLAAALKAVWPER